MLKAKTVNLDAAEKAPKQIDMACINSRDFFAINFDFEGINAIFKAIGKHQEDTKADLAKCQASAQEA